MTTMKTVSKALCALVFSMTSFVAFNAWSQIVSISSDHQDVIVTQGGFEVDIAITMDGPYELIADGGSTTGQPMIRMVVSGNVAWAELASVSRYTAAGTTMPRTDIVFKYTVKPGDMAAPLKLYGYAGSGAAPGGTFQFIWNGWQISKLGDSIQLADWRYDIMQMMAGDLYDPDFSRANIILRTLSFVDASCPLSVAVTETVNWRVTAVNPIESAVVDFYIWPEDYSVVQVGSTPGQPLLISMPSGSTEVDFPMRGLAVGSTDVYLQRTQNYLNNGTLGVTNYIRRAISVSAAPVPTIKVIMVDNGSDNITMDETALLSTDGFRIELSEPYASDLSVQIDTSIAGAAQSSVTFAATPLIVRIYAGETSSSDSKFNVPDGTMLSAATGVRLTPVIQDPTAAAYYSRVREGSVYVNNMPPAITRPASTDVFIVRRGVSTAFDFTVADVPADRATIITRWNFGDSTTQQVVTGHVGQVFHTYATTGSRVVTVQAEDKDGALSAEIQFAVDVQLPLPQPSVTIVPNSFVYDETLSVATGELRVYLSEAFNEDVWVRIETDPSIQANIVLSTTNAFRIAAGTTNYANTVRFSVIDGSANSALNGITLSPVVTNTAAAAHYTDLKATTIYVRNVTPVIVRPLASNLAGHADPTYGYDQIPMGIPFTFTYSVSDVVADRASMSFIWIFGDGTAVETTGANGTVPHTYNSLGDRIVSVRAMDKDGGLSTWVEFKVTIVPPPPPPSVRVLASASFIYEDSDPLSNYIRVELSEAFSNPVVVDLTMDIPGIITLSQSQVSFVAGQTTKDIYITTLDGTAASLNPGVKITPNVIATPAAINHFSIEQSAYVRIKNTTPIILIPAVPAGSGPAYSVPQGTPWTYYWDIYDVSADLPSMQVTWYWGDGASDIVTGGSGSIQHTYSMLGEVIIRVVAVDKDGAANQLQFKINIAEPPPKVIALEISGKDSVYTGETTFYSCIAFYNDESYADVSALVNWAISGHDNLSFVNGVLHVGSIEGNSSCIVSAGYLGFADSMVVTLVYLPKQILPYRESFESGFDAWRGAPGSEFNWLHISGATPSTGTGPSMAAGGDYYIYAEASAPNSPARVAAIEASFDFGAALLPGLSFDYHMYGATMGALYVDVYDGSWHEAVWSRTGQQQQSSDAAWSMASVDLGAYAGISNVLIRVRAVTGSEYLSDIAIDNIALLDNISTMEPSFNKWTVVERVPFGSRSQADTPAGDGIPNLIKYACGLPAMDRCTTADLMTIEPEGLNTFSVLYYKSKTATNVTLQPIWTENLHYRWYDMGIVTEKVSEDVEREKWKATIPKGDSGFIRLRAVAD